MTPLNPRFAALLVRGALLAGLAMSGASHAQADGEKKDFSEAERLLLMSDQMQGVTPPTTLHYGFRKSGSLEEGFKDTVDVQLKRLPDGRCCAASGDFLTGARKVALPEVERAEGNPVILYFLEHDIREMQRLTKGSINYFRKRIRMALFDGASVRDARYTWHGKTVNGKEISIKPFVDDPNRARFEKFARKQYVFSLSDAVPGGVVAIRSAVSADDSAPALIEEELLLAQADAPARTAQPPAVAPSAAPTK